MAKGTTEDQPTEIEDEYELALGDGVEDDTLLDTPAEYSFTITSYGADYPVDTLTNRMTSESFYVPPFQRRFVWSQRHSSRFIESLLMGLPVPGIFLYKEPKTNRHLVVDGQQRLRSLQYFYDGLFKDKKFRLTGVSSEWDGKTYKELDPSDQRKLDDSVVHATIFQQDEPKDSLRSLYFVFERINSGGIRLSPQEIRNCISDGPLMATLRSLNSLKEWRDIFSSKINPRLKDQELILRFLAMMYRREKYERPMGVFLNDFAEEHKHADEETLKTFKNEFEQMIKMARKAFGEKAFRPHKTINAAFFEGVAVGLATRLANSRSELKAEKAKEIYDSLLANPEFMRTCERATADEESVKLRHKIAIEAFGGA